MSRKFDKMVRTGWVATTKSGALAKSMLREYEEGTVPIVWHSRSFVPPEYQAQKVRVTIERDDMEAE